MVETIIETSPDNEFDLAIIGGGIIGMCAAWYAAQQFPHWRIAVFEQDKVGSGASYYSASLHLPYGHTPLRHQLASRSAMLYTALRKVLSLPVKDLPFYGVVSAGNVDRVLTQIVDPNAKESIEKVEELTGRYSGLLIPDGKTIIAGGMAGQAIQNKVANTIAENFSSSQHVIYEFTLIGGITFKNEQYNLLDASGKNFTAKKVVQATGPWLLQLYAHGGPPLQKIRVKKIVAFHLKQQPMPDDAVLYFFDDDAFLMPKYEAGYWLFSFKCDHWDVLPQVDTLRIEETDIQKAHYILQKYYPSFVPLCKEGRVFCDAYMEDGNPMIEALDNGNYIYVGAGSGSGYRLAPAIAEAAIRYFKDEVS